MKWRRKRSSWCFLMCESEILYHRPVSMTSKMLPMATSPFLVGSNSMHARCPNSISSSTRTSHLLTKRLLLLRSNALNFCLVDSLSGVLVTRVMPSPVGVSVREAIESSPMMTGEEKSWPERPVMPNALPQSDSIGEAVPVEEHDDGAERGVLSA
jgi:hypothetical protein